jgi:hypothetical protein
MDALNTMTRDELLRLVRVYALNWLAHDGCWFLATEEAAGIDTAIALDTRAWERFAPAEARRIMREFAIGEGGGLNALERALAYRLYAAINPQSVERTAAGTMLFRMLECRVQRTRQEKSLPAFPCKSVGIVEFTSFARTVDPRIRTRCVACPPDEDARGSCAWEFAIEDQAARQ